MWGTFLSEPLRIVGTVGRYPAVYLMRRMAILGRIAPLTLSRCLYRVLRGISPDFSGLSPCLGQIPYVLLTRAPVAGYRIATIPLPRNLHVLSLSLAFILSQDQTLRCCIFFSSFFLSCNGNLSLPYLAFVDLLRFLATCYGNSKLTSLYYFRLDAVLSIFSVSAWTL